MLDLTQIFSAVRSFQHEAGDILGGQEQQIKRKGNFPLGIVTATMDEFESVKGILIEPKEFFEDSFAFYAGLLIGKNRRVKVILPIPLDSGTEAAVVTTTKLITTYKLDYLFMSGIAAGNRNVTKIGDILIAEKSINYNQIVEMEARDGSRKTKFAQRLLSIDSSLKAQLNMFIGSEHLRQISENAPSKFRDFQFTPRLGLMVTGSSLLRSASKMSEINADYQGVHGLDMETFGFYYAVSTSVKRDIPYFASIKSVSDFGDNTKHDLDPSERKKCALYSSSTFLKYFIQYAV